MGPETPIRSGGRRGCAGPPGGEEAPSDARLAPSSGADELERARWPDEIGAHSYQAGRLAARRREALLQQRQSFVTETVFSHASKLALIERARRLGFVVVFHHIHVSTPELAAARVRTRVSAGGHLLRLG